MITIFSNIYNYVITINVVQHWRYRASVIVISDACSVLLLCMQINVCISCLHAFFTILIILFLENCVLVSVKEGASEVSKVLLKRQKTTKF